jgi:hypothetical protein
MHPRRPTGNLVRTIHQEFSPVIKQLGFVATALAAGMAIVGGSASATEVSVAGHPVDQADQLGLGNLSNLDAVHNVNVVGGVCDNDINVLVVQVPVHDVLEGVGVPVLSPGWHGADGATPDNCAAGDIHDGGTGQGN